MQDIKQLLNKPDVSVCVIEGQNFHTFSGRGLKPLIKAVQTLKEKTAGAEAGDKIIGKAAALILAWAKVKKVYAQILSVEGEKVFIKYGIEYAFGQKVPFIENRDGTGMCPMEIKCTAIDTPQEAFELFTGIIKID